MDYRFKYKMQNYKSFRKIHRKKCLEHWAKQMVLRLNTNSMIPKIKNGLIRPLQKYQSLLCESLCKENEKGSYRLRESICKPHIQHKTSI